MKKHFIRLLLVLAVCLLPAAASALDAGELYWLEFPFWDEETEAADLGLPEDSPIPLFAAPFDEALPLEPIPAGESFLLQGTLQAQTWAMAETGDGRTGWIRIDPDACELPYEDDLEIRRMLCRVTAKAGVPAGLGEQTLCTLQEGDTVIVMFVSEDSGLAYAETGVDGQTAWLFTDADALEEIGLVEVEGNTVRVREGVTVLGDISVWEWGYMGEEDESDDDENWYDSCRTVIRPGDIADSGIDLIMLLGYGRTAQLILPDSLRKLGGEAIVYGKCDELRLPEGLEICDSDAIYGTDIGRLVIPAGCAADLPDGDYVTIGRFEVEEGNPRYRDIDGVLFSADGKTLIRYPDMRRETHYDVPAGTEVIGRSAFSDDSMNSPLQTISLPIGLRRIEAFAFGGCGRLRSLAVPLTVTEIADSAFYACVSLERLSLPPGLSVQWYGYAEQADFTWYNGDNGATERDEDRKPSFRYYTARVVSPSDAEAVPLWRDKTRAYRAEDVPVDTRARVTATEGDMASVVLEIRYETPAGEDWRWGSTVYWIPLECLRPDTTGNTLFTLTGAVNKATGEHYGEYDVDELSHGTLSVLIQEEFDPEESDWNYRCETFTRDEVTLLRSGDNSRTLAYLCSPDESAIPVLDAPGGGQTDRTYDGEQAIVLERRDGWVRIRTLRLTGWVPEGNVWVAEAE